MNAMEERGPGFIEAGAEPRPPAPPAWSPRVDPRRKSVVLATLLSGFPGLGHIYVGYYQVGFLHILIFASLVTILAGGAGGLTPLLALSLAFFVLYNFVDGARRASLYNLALDQAGSQGLPPFELPRNRGSMTGGLFLIGMGALFLLHTRFDMDLYWLEEWWPLGLIAIGVYLFQKDRKSRGESR
ncbi:MAG TPA: DUF5668 domain-containing protein [Candidatus Krumholzibacteria bacterium]|nr:DUF5668 domain-containing protein [Candidatus Krumholzibacteria bacterium]